VCASASARGRVRSEGSRRSHSRAPTGTHSTELEKGEEKDGEEEAEEKQEEDELVIP